MRHELPTNIRWFALLLFSGLAMVSTLTGCRKTLLVDPQGKPNQRRVYHSVVNEVVSAPSAQVIQAVHNAIEATKLELESSSTTNIDAVFVVRSALRKEFRIIVLAVTHHRTRVNISALDKQDKNIAQLILERVKAGLPRVSGG